MTEHTTTEERASLVHHQFDDYQQQHEAAGLGIWLFLITEVLFFGVLLTGYTVYRTANAAAWDQASHGLHLLLGSINTAILLTSSLTMALAVRAGRLGRKRATILLLLLTTLLGCSFLCVKGCEYYLEIREHKFPLLGFRPETATPGAENMFYSFYWVMTGVHSAHMVAGVLVMVTLAGLVWRSGKAGERMGTVRWANAIENAGLYWHFVDIVWVFLYPLLYLAGHS